MTHEDVRLQVAIALRSNGYRGKIVLTSHSDPDTRRLLESGADLVLEPFQDAADRAIELISGEVSGKRTSFEPLPGENLE